MRHPLLASPVLLIALLALPRAAATAVPFSRAAWIEGHEHEAHFEGGALPGRRGHRAAAPAATVSEAGNAAAQDTQVSFDILAPGAGGSQPETEAEPFLAIDPADEKRLLAAFQEGRFESGGAEVLTYALSKDGGRTWGNAALPGLTLATGGIYERASDPWVAFGPAHRAYYVALAFDETRPDNGVYVSSSDDGGGTWGSPVPVHIPTGTDFDDKEAVTVDSGSASPFLGRVYVAWDMVTQSNDQPLLVAHSEDGGATFSTPVTVDANPTIGAYPVVSADGVVHLVWLRFEADNEQSFYTARSSDGGATWSDPVHIAQVRPRGVRDMRTADGLASVAVDKRGSLFVVWQDGRFSASVDQVLMSRSSDGGDTWSAPKLISDGPNDAPAFTPAVAVDGQGRVGVAYYSLRNDPNRRFLTDEYLTISRNGGLTFSRSARVSQSSWDVTQAAVSRGYFLGDYQGLAADSRRFHPLFVATFLPSKVTAGRRQPDVFTIAVR